jgi:UDP-glucose 4-epimerase
MRVLVSGASGFLGRWTVATLISHGHTVRALVRPTTEVPATWDERVDVVRLDLRGDIPESIFDGVDALIHLAAGMAGDATEQFAVTVVGTERLLDVMARTRTTRLVLASSFAVYDWAGVQGELTESAPLAQNLDERGAYAAAKGWQERVVRRLSDRHGFALTVLRPGLVWGPDSDSRFGIFKSVGPAHLVIGPFRRLPLSYVEHCAACFVRVLEQPAAVGETFNVVDGDGVRAWRAAKQYLARTGTPGFRVPVPYRLTLAVAHVVSRSATRALGPGVRLPNVAVPARVEANFKPLRFSNAKATRLLGWQPTCGFDEALDRTYGPRRVLVRAPLDGQAIEPSLRAPA